MLQKKLKQITRDLGLHKQKYTSHSLRRGGVAWAFRNGCPESLIKVYGDWSSNAYQRYLEFPVEMRVAVSYKMTKKLKNLKNLF